MRKKFLVLIIICCNFCLFGCVNVSSRYVAQQKYGLFVSLPKPVAFSSAKTLEILYPEISMQFAGANFVYCIHDQQYTSDYYNMFFVSPLEQIYHNELKYLQASQLFKYASANVVPLHPDYILKTRINELYADYRYGLAPKAIMSVQFVLIDMSSNPQKVIMQRSFTRELLLTQKTSNALVTAWSNELDDILKQLVIVIHQQLPQKRSTTANK